MCNIYMYEPLVLHTATEWKYLRRDVRRLTMRGGRKTLTTDTYNTV